jgi:hypothetical protein
MKKSPQDYDELRSMIGGESVIVYDATNESGIVQIRNDFSSLERKLEISEQYSDSSHLHALYHLTEKYDDGNLPRDLSKADVESISAASSSDRINVEWVDEIEVTHQDLNPSPTHRRCV